MDWVLGGHNNDWWGLRFVEPHGVQLVEVSGNPHAGGGGETWWGGRSQRYSLCTARLGRPALPCMASSCALTARRPAYAVLVPAWSA